MTRLRPLADGVLVATSRRDRTNSVVLAGPGRDALVVDPAWTPDELAALAADVARLALQPVAGFATHAHFDHLLWHPGLGAVPRYASATTVALARRERAGLLEGLGPAHPRRTFDDVPPLEPLRGAVPWPGPPAEAVVTDAHERGHSSLWIERLGLLVAGDLLSDVELPLLADGDPAGTAYRAGLERLRPIVRRARLVIPGHGAPTRDGTARLDADLRALDALEAGRFPQDARLDRPAERAAWARALTRRG